MQVICLTDSLGYGGAQRQLCTLAVLLKRQGVDVSVVTYHPLDFFLPMLREAGIEHTCLTAHSSLGRAIAIRSFLRTGAQDVVLAFQDHCSIYAEVAAIPRRDWGLVVSERSAVPGSQHGRSRYMRNFHRVADYVTTNSHTNRLMIEQAVPGLAGRVVTVYNTLDQEVFSPATDRPTNADGLRLVVAASYRELKNPVGFVEAIAIARAEAPQLNICLDWYGAVPGGRTVYDQTSEFVHKRGLETSVRLHYASSSIVEHYQAADAVVLPSFYEGLPNSVCEAMACGRPILMSNVADAGNLVRNAENGFLFDPNSVSSMAEAILKFARLAPEQRNRMGQASREMANRLFDPTRVLGTYVSILSAAASRSRIPIDHWIPEVPDSAYHALN